MHTDLSPHLHTEKCNELVEMLRQCHVDHPIGKFFGFCNSFDHQMTKCMKAERLARRAKNIEKSNDMKRKLREIKLEQ
ncbi:hypothetical protein NQ317_006588 [Molorchus minor]|uniref:COX assembly mitochondrial protein n=1 Tax=Molorchus minor TaxID=1323400 RepID=A0ABQ9K1S3_9CUCU|nr:hypothetical protein NQ317_006588 [Molorchus minor]